MVVSMTTTQHEDLIPLGHALPLRVYLRSLWDRRQFALSVPLGELRAQHMNTVLGNIWYLLNPVLQVGVYFLVFGVLLRTSRGIDNFICFLAIGVFSYGYMQKSITGCAASIVTNEGLIRSLSFPRAILPLAAVVRETLAFSTSVALMMVLALVTGEPLRSSWLGLLVLVPLMGLFSLGVGFVFARLADRLHDVRNLLPFLFRIAFYLSGIIYAFDLVVARTRYHDVMGLLALNPFFTYGTLVRHVLMSTYEVHPLVAPWLWPAAILYPVTFMAAGFAFFRSAEQRYGRG
jgi:teichoic acid transport system permease protein